MLVFIYDLLHSFVYVFRAFSVDSTQSSTSFNAFISTCSATSITVCSGRRLSHINLVLAWRFTEASE